MKSPIRKQNRIANEEYFGCVLAYGHFSLIHPGHIRYLKHAKGLGNKLVVAVTNDEVKYPFKQHERAESVALLGLAEEVVMLSDEGLKGLIEMIRPNVLALGTEYKRNNMMSYISDLVREQGGRIEYHKGDIPNIAVDLLDGDTKEMNGGKRSRIHELYNKCNISKESVTNEINNWSRLNMLVVGDLIVDEYSACEALGMSAEAPVIVVKELKNKRFIGGAAVVAAHINALGVNCTLVSVTGKDEISHFAKEELDKMGITAKIIIDGCRPTTFKKRYLADSQKLLRVSRFEDNEIDSEIEQQILRIIETESGKVDGIVVSDFSYGVITERIIRSIKGAAKKKNIPVFADSQSSTQVGSILKYRGFTVIAPNEKEARLALGDRNSSVEQIALQLIKKTDCNMLVMKLGSEGFIIYENANGRNVKRTAFPALCRKPIDVAGAGDSVLAILATGISGCTDIQTIGVIASCMAAIAVEQMGNAPINRYDLVRRVNEEFIK